MRFIIDECTGPMVAKWLRELQYDVVSVYETSRGVDDCRILSQAVAENRILITNDKDFGTMIIREKKAHKGVILLRLGDERTPNKIAVLKKLLEQYEDKIVNRFVVVSEKTLRIIHTD